MTGAATTTHTPKTRIYLIGMTIIYYRRTRRRGPRSRFPREILLQVSVYKYDGGGRASSRVRAHSPVRAHEDGGLDLRTIAACHEHNTTTRRSPPRRHGTALPNTPCRGDNARGITTVCGEGCVCVCVCSRAETRLNGRDDVCLYGMYT